MTKKEIIFDYLAKDGNKNKSLRKAVEEISAMYNVTISVMMIQKTKKEMSVQESVHPESVQSVQSVQESVHPESVQSVQSVQESVHPESVQSVQSVQESVQSVQSVQESVHPVNRQDWLDSLMNGIVKATNIFEMTEAVRQCDVYVQETGESVKEDLECVYDGLVKWQKLIIDNYGLKNRLSFIK